MTSIDENEKKIFTAKCTIGGLLVHLALNHELSQNVICKKYNCAFVIILLAGAKSTICGKIFIDHFERCSLMG